MSTTAYQNFICTVAVAPAPPLTGTVLSLEPGQGTLLPPNVPYDAVVLPGSVMATALNSEVVRVMRILADRLVVSRQQQGSPAISIAAGDTLAGVVTAGGVNFPPAPAPPAPPVPVVTSTGTNIVIITTTGTTAFVGGAPDYVAYPGPPAQVPPLLQNICVDVNGRQWQYWGGGWN